MSFPNPNARCQCGGALRIFTADTVYHRNLKFRKCQFHGQGSNHHFEWADGHICSPVCQPRSRASISSSRSSTNHTMSSQSPLPAETSPTEEPAVVQTGSELMQLINLIRLENSQLQAKLILKDGSIARLELENAKLRRKAIQSQEAKTAADAKFRVLLVVVAIWIALMYNF